MAGCQKWRTSIEDFLKCKTIKQTFTMVEAIPEEPPQKKAAAQNSTTSNKKRRRGNGKLSVSGQHRRQPIWMMEGGGQNWRQARITAGRIEEQAVSIGAYRTK
jgi:hypothetical protein